MKKFITITVLLLGFIGFGQMKVSEGTKAEIIGQVKPMGIFTAELSKTNDIYILAYRDPAYQQIDVIKSFGFKVIDLDTMYSLLSDFTNVKEGDVKNVDLEDGGHLNIEYKKAFGKMYASTMHTDRAGVSALLPYLTNKQLSKLFGKGK